MNAIMNIKNPPIISTYKSNILGALYGQAIGDAFGMPSELWSRHKIASYFGWISDFLDGPEENIAANEFKKGQFTDDTSQAVALMDAIIEESGNVVPETIAKHIMFWAERIDAFDKNILGPTSKSALLALRNGVKLENIQANGVTNGAPMRISPIGCLTSTQNKNLFIDNVRLACAPTHKSDIAIAGSCVVAWAISRAIEGYCWDEIIPELISLADEVQNKYESTFSASLSKRIQLALNTVNTPITKKEILVELYELIGSGMDVIESIPTAIALVSLADTKPMLCAELAANLGGDTDTIGAIATAICGALNGINSFPEHVIRLINEANLIDFNPYAEKIANFRMEK